MILLVCLLACISYVASATLQTVKARQDSQASQQATQTSQQSLVASTGLITPVAKGLSSKFTDKTGTLMADPPTSPDQWVNPDTLVIARLESGRHGEDETPGTSWADFDKYLSTAIGKKVTDTAYTGAGDQMAQFANGAITLAAVHPADAPFLVNNYGFHPIAVLGTTAGANGNHVDIIVPAGSSLSGPADLKGHLLTITEPSSITGYRAAIMVLMQDFDLRPYVDYRIEWSMKQKSSIVGIAKKKYEAAAVSDDKLQSMLDDGDINKSQFKVIYQSDVIPRTTIGYFYSLKPDLADKVRQAILSYDPPKTPDTMKFLPIDYKKDFSFVRTIDDSFDPRLNSKTGGKVHTD